MYEEAIESTTLIPGMAADRSTPSGNDHAKDAVESGGLPLRTLERFLDDLRSEPENWRREADRAADYYDGNQLSEEVIDALEDRGLGPLMRNLTAPTIDAVLGLEEKNRQDWRVVTDIEEQQEVAEGLSQKMADAERESQADRAISDAYAGAIKAGFAAVEVSRATNPFVYPYRVETIHRRELWWDPRSKKPDWSDARFVMRKRWFDTDVVCAHFPVHARLIRYAAEGWEGGWEQVAQMLGDAHRMELMRAADQERSTKIDAMEWRDVARGRVCVYEVWYRTFHRGSVLRLQNGRMVECDPKNQQHMALLQAGLATKIDAVYDKFRCAYFVGPHRIADFASSRRKFPYVPFWGKREDLTGAPYGLIRSMFSVQDEVNARLAKFMWLLSSRRTIVDDDAIDGKASEFNSMADVSAEVGNANAFIVLNSGRRNQDALRVDENLELAEAQHRAMQDAMLAFSQVSGVYAQMLGNSGGLTANSAIKTVLDQGTVTLAEINANYIFGRRLVGELLLDLIKEDSGHAHQMTVDTSVTKKTIYFNRRGVDPSTGAEIVENDVQNTPVKVQLSDVPSTASYRQQQLVSMSEIVKSLPPDAQGIMAPFMLELTDMPNRKEAAKILREKMGIAVDPNTPEGQQIQQQVQEQQALAKAQLEAEIRAKNAQAAKFEAEAARTAAESDPALISQQREMESAQAQREHEAKLAETSARSQAELAKADAEKMRAQSDVEIAKTTSASEDAIGQLAEELDARMQDFEATLEAFMAQDEAEGTPAKGKKAGASPAKAREARSESRVVSQAIERVSQQQAQNLERLTKEQAAATQRQLDEIRAQFDGLVQALQSMQQERAAPRSKQIEIQDPETGKMIRATVRDGN